MVLEDKDNTLVRRSNKKNESISRLSMLLAEIDGLLVQALSKLSEVKQMALDLETDNAEQ